MEQIIAIAFIFIGLFLPYILFVWLYGVTLIKKLYEKEWIKQKGIKESVVKWEQLTPEERMEISRQEISDSEWTKWLGSPTPQDEQRMRDEKVFQEGLVHPPKTDIQMPKDIKSPKP